MGAILTLMQFSHSYLGGKGISKDHEYQWTQCVSLSDGSQRCSNADSIGFFALGKIISS